MNALRTCLLACSAAFLLNGDAFAFSFFHHDSTPRHARKASNGRPGAYPLGAREFYYQFAESRSPAYPAEAAAEGFTLIGLSERGTHPDSSSALPATLVPGSHMIATDTPHAEPMPEQHSSPAGLALPAAALGLMLFVARRRSTSL